MKHFVVTRRAGAPRWLRISLLAMVGASCGTSRPARPDVAGAADAGDAGGRDNPAIGDANNADGSPDGATAEGPADLPVADLAPAAITGPWSSRDIGDVGEVKGSLTASSVAFTVRGGGAAIGGAADAFFFSSQTLTGDGEIVARVKSLLKVMPGSQVGIMVRGGAEAGAPNVFLSVPGDPAADGRLQSRTAPGGATTSMAFATVKEGQILRLVRTTKVVTAYRGDGQGGWFTIGVVEIDLPQDILLGLAISGADPLTAAAAELDLVRVSNFQRSAATKDWTLGDLGTVGSNGIATADTITLGGLGELVATTSDVGVFVLQGAAGAQTITARLASFSGGGTNARAGLTIREGASGTLGAATPYAFMGITPSSGTQFHSRVQAGGISQAGALVSGIKAPAWIRLEKLDNPTENTSTFTGFFSSDGKQWNVLDSRTFLFREPYSIGFTVLAASASSFAAATFSDISISAPK